MKLLILGGTEFVGRAIRDEAMLRGWAVTVVNRGTHPPVPDGAAQHDTTQHGIRTQHGIAQHVTTEHLTAEHVTALRADRTVPGALAAAVAGCRWDAVVDTWSGAPVAVLDAARALADHVDRYAYISTRSVYAFPTPAFLDEDAPLVDATPDASDADYAQAKRGGELAVEAHFGSRALIPRPGLILGPHENIGRLPWWLTRIAQGGVVPAPGPSDLPLQYIDARDLAIWTLDAIAAGLGGAFNVVSPPGHTTMDELLETCIRVTGSDAKLRWFTPEQILAAGIEPWTELPIWLPPGELYDSLHQGNVTRALSAGLRCRPIGETVADTWRWLSRLDGPAPIRPDRPRPGLTSEAEAALMRAVS